MRYQSITIEPDTWGRGDALVFDGGQMLTNLVIDAEDEHALLDLLLRRELERDDADRGEGFRAAAAWIGYEVGHESWLRSAIRAWVSSPTDRAHYIARREG